MARMIIGMDTNIASGMCQERTISGGAGEEIHVESPHVEVHAHVEQRAIQVEALRYTETSGTTGCGYARRRQENGMRSGEPVSK